MNPTSESTKLEGPGKFLEYTGVGKLRKKKVIITGGEYVFPFLAHLISNIDRIWRWLRDRRFSVNTVACLFVPYLP